VNTQKRQYLFASLLGIIFLTLLGFGVSQDRDAVAPAYGPPCWFFEVDVRNAQQKHPEDAPPPDAATANSGVAPLSFPLQPDHLNWRLGLGLSNGNAEIWAQRLGTGWYIDWSVQPRYPAQMPEHWQMIRLGRGCIYPRPEAIAWLTRHYPGAVWIIGNEPDNRWQDNVVPEEYAQVYHQLYSLLKENDPTAQVAMTGVTQPTPLRLAYLDRVLAAYSALYGEPLPTDWWTVHGFVLREEDGVGAGIPAGFSGIEAGQLYTPEDHGDVRLFQAQMIAFRSWMAENGYQDTPLVITEYGILLSPEYGYSPDVVAQYLLDTFVWLDSVADPEIGFPADDYRLVQRWAWYSVYDNLYTTSNLANLKSDALTEIGHAFVHFARISLERAK